MRQLALPVPTIHDLALSPDGQSLAVAHGSRGLSVYDPFDGRQKIAISGHFSRVRFRADGCWLAGSEANGVAVQIHDTGASYFYMRHHEYFQYADFPDDHSIAFLSGHAYRRFSLAPEKSSTGEIHEISNVEEFQLNRESTEFRFQPLGLGPDRKMVGIEYDSTLYERMSVIWEPIAKRPLAIVPDEQQDLKYSTKYYSSGNWFALASQAGVAVYRWADLSESATRNPGPQPRGILQTLRETLIGPSRRSRHERRYRDLPVFQPKHRWPEDRQPSSDPHPFAFLPTGDAILCRGVRSSIELRDLATGSLRTRWQFSRAWPRVLAVAPDGLTAMAAVKGGTVVFWDLE